MFTYKKYFDALTADTQAAPAETPSLASIMVKSGSFNSPGREGVIPSINTEKKEEPQPATPATPALATEPTPAAQAKPESPSPKQEPTPASPQIADPAKVPSWQEVLKTQQPDAIFKELGFDEKVLNLSSRLKDKPEMVAFLDHWESKGEMKPYLDALNTDYQKMSPEEVMKHQLRAQNPELDAKQLDTLFKIKVTNRYKLDEQLYSEDEVAEGRIELLADAKPIRGMLAEEQKKFLLPTAPEPKPAGPDLQAEKWQQEITNYKSKYTEDPFIKDIQANKRITIGEGPEAFHYPVDPEALVNQLVNVEQWQDLLDNKVVNADGSTSFSPKVRTQALLSAIGRNETGFFKALETHYKSLGGKAAIEPIENAKPLGSATPAHAEVDTNNPVAAMAKKGRITMGGE